MKILIIDNFDSFTYNLYQYVGELLQARKINFQLDVKRNNEISLVEIKTNKYDKIIISPGSGDASDIKYFGVCAEVLIEVGKTIPVLGVCLGMQGLAYYYGGKVIRMSEPVHGKTSLINHDGKGVFANLPQNLEVMRYHSLIVDSNNVPDCLEISAKSDDGNIMGLRHKDYPIEGVQFHPESFATEGGKKMLSNFLNTDYLPAQAGTN